MQIALCHCVESHDLVPRFGACGFWQGLLFTSLNDATHSPPAFAHAAAQVFCV